MQAGNYTVKNITP